MQSIIKTSVATIAGSLAMLAFAAPAFAASSVSITSSAPSTCQLSGTSISISGTATADAPPGGLDQYAVDVDWGDGSSETVLPKGTFSSADNKGQDTESFANVSHSYSAPGEYHVVATIYHQNINGKDNVSSGANAYVVCVVSPLTISKTATTTLDRAWSWTIDKTVSTTSLMLADGQSYSVDYDVTANASATDSNWKVGGTISVTNPAGNPTIGVAVTDSLATDGAVTVNCPSSTIAPGAILVCTYNKALPGANNQLNTATVTVSDSKYAVLTDTGMANVDFASATVNETDESITVTDDKEGALGVVNASQAPKTFSYSTTFGKGAGAEVELACGANPVYTNTASFTTNDTATTGSDSTSLNVTVACVPGCTLTQGYWKTHNDSFKGGAPSDSNWANLAGGLKEATVFFPAKNTQTWFNVFWTAPAGNVYYQLAHQYMAAKLNELNGAAMPAAVQTAFNTATGYFNTTTPVQAAGLKGAAKTNWTNVAGTLASFNEGKAGVPHCSEQNP